MPMPQSLECQTDEPRQSLDELLKRAMRTRTMRGLLLRNLNTLVCKMHETAGRMPRSAFFLPPKSDWNKQ